MAAADPPAGLMDVASALSQDDIPFKLRCAICNKLATNAFRLPCCDQSICETCQASLSDTCPVCAHTPVSPDLCKPNKALRTTLKAFLRTEEKKREKDRQSAAPPTPTTSEPGPAELSTEKDASEAKPTVTPEVRAEVHLPSETKSDEAATEAPPADTAANGTIESAAPESAETETEAELVGDKAPEAPSAEADTKPTDGDASVDDQSATTQDPSQQNGPSMMNMGPGSFPGMNWNGNANLKGMNPFMANPMFTFPNPMGMPMMNMDPMAANQGMFGDYGMNMTGMGMNMGMNFNGQGMYGSLGWDGSQQNMWHGGQDNFNPNAFANGTGPPYGGAFGGSNMSYPSNSGFQSGYYGPGYGRGGFRGGFQRGGFAGHHANPAFSHQHPPEEGSKAAPVDGEGIPQASEHDAGQQASETTTADGTAETIPAEAGNDGQQLHGIPTVDSQNQPFSMGPGYGRGGSMQGPAGRGGFWGGPYQPHIEQPKLGPGVEGAPAAPRAMRQGLPNTSVLRQRGFHVQGKGSVGSNTPALSQRDNSEPLQDSGRARSPSRAPSQPPAGFSRSHSPPQSPASRHHSPTLQVEEDRDGRRGGQAQRTEDDYDNYVRDRRSCSPSRMSSSRASRRQHRDSDRDRSHRSHRSRRHRSRSYSRSRSPTRNGDARPSERLPLITVESELNGHKEASKTGHSRDRVSSHRFGRDRPSRREEERDSGRARESQHRDRDRERHRHRRDRDRDSERERRRDRERDRERDRGHGRTDRDRKRSRRDRSESAASREDSSLPQARRVKRDAGDDQDRGRDGQAASAASKPEPEKDPYTLEREARNRERMLREQQNREGTKSSQSKSSHRRNGRQERLVGGRRINYKYEDEL